VAEIKGAKRLQRKFEILPELIEEELKKSIVESGELLKNKSRVLIQRGSRSGKIYKRGKVRHIASAPGEPPKTDRGNLVSSIFNKILKGGLTSEVGSDLKYGKWLELGTKNIKPRPWLFPTFEGNKNKIKRNMIRRIKRQLRRVTR
jgi:HK97 gp10 family phage protein